MIIITDRPDAVLDEEVVTPRVKEHTNSVSRLLHKEEKIETMPHKTGRDLSKSGAPKTKTVLRCLLLLLDHRHPLGTPLIMSADEVCGSCSKAAADDVKLKKCACDLVKYCNLDCQKNHRPQHKKACKKQMAAIHDKRIFSQPDGTHFGECPICLLPLRVGPGNMQVSGGSQAGYSVARKQWMLNACCCKRICIGCDYANKLREMEQRLEPRCPFCREELRGTDEEIEKDQKKRVEAMIRLHCFRWGRSATTRETTMVRLNISPRQLNWETWMGIMNYHVCIIRGMELSWMRKRKSITLKRQRLVDISTQGTILGV
jgi:hypothetical protein